MIRSELVTRVAAQNPHLYERDIDALIKAMFNRIATALASGDRVEIRNFGTFSVRQRTARVGRNPRSGEPVEVKPKTMIGFKVGKSLHNRINGVGDGLDRRADRFSRAPR